MFTNPSHRLSSIGMPIAAFLMFCLSKLLPKHGKRIIFISSLYVQVTQLERLKADVVSKLNTVMNLAHREEALHFPAAISQLVWRNSPVGNVLTKELLDQDIDDVKVREVSKKVVNLTPNYLRYGTPSDMEEDVRSLILNGRDLAGPQLAAAA